MEKISISLKPILWRLLLWRSYPGLLLTGIATLISLVTPTPSFVQVFSTHMIPWLLGIFTAEILFSLFEWFSKKLNIEIQDDKITGSKSGFFSGIQKIYLHDLERTSLIEKNTYQKFFGFHKLCSTRGEVINFEPFVYKKSLVDEFYNTLRTIQDKNLRNRK